MIYGSAPKPKMGRKAMLIGLAGIPATAIWIPGYMLVSPGFVCPGNIGGFFLCVVIYGWPLIAAILVARRCPDEVRTKCCKCDWQEAYEIVSPNVFATNKVPPPVPLDKDKGEEEI
ncbi:MAG: hypothetical protein VCA38_20880 [Roseibacillus sp.]|jgi:hypothetical protein